MKGFKEFFTINNNNAKTLLFFVFLAFALFWTSFINTDYFWDDERFIFLNPKVLQVKNFWEFWNIKSEFFKSWPLGYSIFWTLLKYNPLNNLFFYKIVNIIFHGLNSFILYKIIKKFNFPNAFFLALIFLVHPLQIETVSWIFQLLTVLAFFFFILSFYFLIQFIEGKKWLFLVFSLLLYMCSIMTKSFSALAPVLYPVLFYITKMEKKKYFAIIPFLFIGLVSGILSIRGTDFYLNNEPNVIVTVLRERAETLYPESKTAVKNDENKSYFDYIYKERPDYKATLDLKKVQAQAPWHYFSKVLFPYPLQFIYPQKAYPLWLNLSALFALFIAPLILMYIHKERFWILIPFLSFIFILPFLGLTPITFFYWSNVADRYTYFFILTLVFAIGIYNRQRKSAVAKNFIAAYLAILSVMNISYGLKFNNPKALYEEIVTYKKHPVIYSLLFEKYLENMEFEKAKQTLEEGLKLFPDNENLQIDRLRMDGIRKAFPEI